MAEFEPIIPAHKKKRWSILLITVILLIIIRLILPYVILHYANKTLAKMHGYYGRIKDIDLAIYRGAYKIKKLYIHKKDSLTHLETEFFDSQEIDLSIHWAALLHGKIVGELELEEPTLRFIKDKTEPQQIQKDTTDFRVILDKFMPLRINRFEITNGTIKYIDKHSNPKVDIEMNNTRIRAENLTNVKGESTLPATVTASADMYEGTLDLFMKLDPLARYPTFDMNTELKNVNLTKLNDFFKAYGKFDINKGTMGLYVEIAAKEGQFAGYIKPLIKGLKVLGPEDKDKDLLHKFWEAVVGTVGVIFRNQKHDQLATRLPLEGSFGKTKVFIWSAILDILRNAFIEALKPSLENDVDLGTVGNPEDIAVKIKKQDEDKKNKRDKKDKEVAGDKAVKNKEETKEKTTEEKGEKKKKNGLFKRLFHKKDKNKQKENKETDKNE